MEQTKNGVTWDDSYWSAEEDETRVFIAEALINDPPCLTVSVDSNPATIECFLWSVGGDTVVATEPLGECIMKACQEYKQILSQGQLEDVVEELASLEALERTIQDGKKYLMDLLTAYDNR